MILFSELLPNPVGDDKEGEFFELVNNGDGIVSLMGWSVRDKAGKEYMFSDVSVPAHGFFVLPYAQSRISLNNDAETLALVDASGVVMDLVSYEGGIAEGVSLVRGGDGSFLPSAVVTMGESNIVVEPEFVAPQLFWEIQEHDNVLYEGSPPASDYGVVVPATVEWEIIVWGIVVAGLCAWGFVRVYKKVTKESE